MWNKISISIVKNNKQIGNCLFERYCDTESVFRICKDIIDNYNDRLCSKKLEDDILAVRLFTMSDSEGFYSKFRAGIKHESFADLTKKYIRMFLEEDNGDYAFIGTTEDDKIYNNNEAQAFITINLDIIKIKSSFVFCHCGNVSDFLKKHSELTYDDLTRTSIESICNFDFCELYDMCILLSNINESDSNHILLKNGNVFSVFF